MKKVMQFFIKCVLIGFAMVLSWIIMSGLINYQFNIYNFNPIFVAVGIVIYVLFITLLYKFLFAKIEKIRFVEFFMFILFAVLAIYVAVYFRTTPRGILGIWDMGTCYEIAEEWVKDGTVTNTFYPAEFPNNIMMIVVDAIILSGLKLIGVNDWVSGITVVTALVITMSIVVSFYIVNRIGGRKKALTFMFIALLTTPLYLYATEYYTDTYSMLTSVLLFYLWLVFDSFKGKKVLTVLLIIVYAVVLFMAIKIKLTSSFVLIAIILYEIVQGNYKTVIKRLVGVLPITVCLIMLFNYTIVNKMATKENRDKYEVPTEHWIMMGMNGVGQFEYSEYAITLAPENVTYEQRKMAARNKIVERIKTRSMDEHVKNLNNKLCFAWHDGTFWISRLLRVSPANDGKLHEYVISDYPTSKYWKYLPQCLHFAMLIFVFANVCRIIRQRDWKSKDLIAIITMLGVMIFLLIWENRSRYLVNIIPIMLIAQINGIDYVTGMIYKKSKQ